MFEDDNKNKIKDAGENNYTAAQPKPIIEIHNGIGSCEPNTLVPITMNEPASGKYDTKQTLASGTYTVCFINPPTGYQLTFPIPFITANFSVSVGTSCDASNGNPVSPPSPLAATCDVNNNIINLNFGITNSVPWIQSMGLDMRIDSGYSQSIPKGQYASLKNSKGVPGIIFSGDWFPTFGEGEASEAPYNWSVGGPTKPKIDVYTAHHYLVTTSYDWQLSNSKDYGLKTTDLTTYCTGDLINCTLPSDFPHDLYLADDNLNLNSYTFTDNQNYVILVNGDLRIKGNIKIDIGSTATFSVKGNIYVNEDVGESDPSSTITNIDGFYSTDKDFIVEGTNGINCPTADKRLNIGGSVVTNASLSKDPLIAKGKFINNRDLCENNLLYPSIYFSERLDLILNAPLLIQQVTRIYKEVPPK